jgi:pantoate--beta-alanine ligase
MDVVNQIEAVQLRIAQARQTGRPIVLVPTMGALHRGHLALVERARREPAGYVVVSIFVNPTQFSPGEDLDAYPRRLEADCSACEAAGVDLVFAPAADQIYTSDASTVVHVQGLTETLCGPHRPGHFDGVATIVTKLLNIVQPDRAIFGEKDYQQLQVIRRLVRDLNLPVEIDGAPTVRESDGLALSSRNAYLSTTQRQQATSLFQALSYAAERVQAGDEDALQLIDVMRKILTEAGPVSIDYVQIVDPETLEDVVRIDRPVQAAIAARIGQTRLIDNLRLDPPQKSA